MTSKSLKSLLCNHTVNHEIKKLAHKRVEIRKLTQYIKSTQAKKWCLVAYHQLHIPYKVLIPNNPALLIVVCQVLPCWA